MPPRRQRRCGAKVVSLTCGEAHANSRRWLTPRRHSLHSDEDHLLPSTSLVLSNRRDSFEDLRSIRYGLQQFLEYKGLTNEIDANSDVRSWRFERSPTCLPVLGNVARVALWGGSFWSGWWRSGVFLTEGDPRNIIFRGEVQATRTYCGQRCFLRSEADLNMPCPTMRAGVVNGYQGAPWSEELDGKELHGAACDLGLRGSVVFYTSSTWKSTHLSPSTSVVFCWVVFD